MQYSLPAKPMPSHFHIRPKMTSHAARTQPHIARTRTESVSPLVLTRSSRKSHRSQETSQLDRGRVPWLLMASCGAPRASCRCTSLIDDGEKGTLAPWRLALLRAPVPRLLAAVLVPGLPALRDRAPRCAASRCALRAAFRRISTGSPNRARAHTSAASAAAGVVGRGRAWMGSFDAPGA